MAPNLAKKRKLQEVNGVPDTAVVAQKTKKAKKPAPVAPREEIEDDDVSDDENLLENDDDVDSDDNDEDEAEEADPETNGAAAAEEDEDDVEADGEDELPTESGPLVPLTTDCESFEDLKLSEKTMLAIKEMGFSKMTSIQRSVGLARSHYD